MAFKFPRRIPTNGQTQNATDMNDGFLHVVEEMGKLNEHNIQDNIQAELNVFTDMSNDIAWRSMTGRQAIPVDAADFRLGQAGSTGPEPITRVSRVNINRSWVDVFGPNTTVPSEQWITKQVISEDGGLYRIIVGGQIINPQADPTTVVGNRRYGYAKTGIKVNGTIIPESVCGDQDEFYSATNMETGLSGKASAFQMDITIPLSPGVHTIGLVATSMAAKYQKQWDNPDTPSDRDAAAPKFEIINCEIFILEMAR